MPDIKLEHTGVMKQLEDMEKALSRIVIESPDEISLGENKLAYTDAWLASEQLVKELLEQYVQAVKQNIEDTKANITHLKEQDEAIAAK
ncbi:hypothetical protein GKZ89_16885 [Bacillus mangrovi]|uniref:YwqI/YxiC family protein n=1 Tax=Metabacillus mangrovi TaxID=1491830 RepID=A0A7X2S7J4_9BACI|nr:DUF5344 family protein [Metabacillus mangrovi]MTH55082.1 hypothetical protein [Metabacillus mangrovi]